jgi:hypothetical protein
VTAVPLIPAIKALLWVPLRADADGVAFSGNACAADIDIAIADSEIASSVSA